MESLTHSETSSTSSSSVPVLADAQTETAVHTLESNLQVRRPQVCLLGCALKHYREFSIFIVWAYLAEFFLYIL